MAFEPSLAEALNALGGLLFVLLGLYVVRVAPGEAKNRAFGLFAVAFGAFTGVSTTASLWNPPLLGSLTWWLWPPLLVLASAGAVWLAYSLVARGTDGASRPFLWAVAVGVAVFVAETVALLAHHGDVRTFFVELGPQVGEPGAALYPFAISLTAGLVASLFVVLYALALAYKPDVDPRVRTEARIVTVALATYLGFIVGAGFGGLVGVSSGLNLLAWSTGIGLVAMVGVAGLWLHRSPRVPETPAARNVALYLLAVPLVGLLAQSSAVPRFGGAYGLTRTVAVFVLAYGVLKHQILDIDQKVEWGVSKTTVAGVFVAVFFMVSEGAQALFADFAGNELIGVLAAGALVFAISPLQRLADRFAAKAVPGGAEAGADAEASYRQALRMALADGGITPEEEDELAERAEELGLGPKRALELRREAEQGRSS